MAQRAGAGDKFLAGDISKQRGQSAVGGVWEQRGGEMNGDLVGPGWGSQHPFLLPPYRRAGTGSSSNEVSQSEKLPWPRSCGNTEGEGCQEQKKNPQNISILIKLPSRLTLSFESTTIHSWHLSSISSPAFQR